MLKDIRESLKNLIKKKEVDNDNKFEDDEGIKITTEGNNDNSYYNNDNLDIQSPYGIISELEILKNYMKTEIKLSEKRDYSWFYVTNIFELIIRKKHDLNSKKGSNVINDRNSKFEVSLLTSWMKKTNILNIIRIIIIIIIIIMMMNLKQSQIL